MKILSKSILLVTVALMGLLSANAQAERREADSRGADPVKKAQYMLRQLSQQKAQLEADNARLSTEVAELKKTLGKVESDLDSTKKTLNKSKASNSRLVDRVKDDSEKFQVLKDKYRETVQLLRTEKANVVHLTNAVTERNEWIDHCSSNNHDLIAINNELVDRYQNKGVWDAVKQSDPLLGISDVKLEVIAEDYRYRIEDLQVVNFDKQNQTSVQGVSSH